MSRTTTGIRRLPFRAAYSISLLQTADLTESGLSRKRNISASSIPFSISLHQSTVGGIPSQSIQKSRPWFLKVSLSFRAATISLREYEMNRRGISAIHWLCYEGCNLILFINNGERVAPDTVIESIWSTQCFQARTRRPAPSSWHGL